MSNNSRLYRNFIILQEDERGYANSSDKTLSGYSKIEARGDRCKISFYAQNLRKDNDKYHIMLICSKKDLKQVVNLGPLEVSDSGKGEITKEYDIHNIGGMDLSYDKISGATICKMKDGIPIYVMYGFLNGEQPLENWKNYKTIMGVDVKPKYMEKIIKDIDKKEDKKYDMKYDKKYDKKDDKKCDKKDDKKYDKKHDMKHDDKHDMKHDDKHDMKHDDKHDMKYDDKHDMKHDDKYDIKYDEKCHIISDKKDYKKDDKKYYEKSEKIKCEKREDFKDGLGILDSFKQNIEEEIEAQIQSSAIKNNGNEQYTINNVYEVKENIRGKFEDYEDEIELGKEQKLDLFKIKGSIGEYFEAIAEGFEQYKDGFDEIKYCKWYKIPIHDLYEMSNVSNYNKYTLAYYPMLNYYPYIKRYGYFMLGYKCDSEGNLKYIVYAVPGRKDKDEQPYDGRTGFVTWVNKQGMDDVGCWLMFYDFKNSTIVVPMQ